MLKVTFKQNFTWKSLEDEILRFDTVIKEKIKNLGYDTLIDIHDIINTNRKRPTTGSSKLIDSIGIEMIETTDSLEWGIGNISQMNTMFPGWRAVNYGSSHMVGKHLPLGGFAPGENQPNANSFRKGRWETPGSYRPIVTKPIPAMNFVEKTIDIFLNKLNTLLASN